MMTLAGVFLGLIVIGLAFQLLGKAAGDGDSESFGRFLAGCGLKGCGFLAGVVLLGLLGVAVLLYWLLHDAGR